MGKCETIMPKQKQTIKKSNGGLNTSYNDMNEQRNEHSVELSRMSNGMNTQSNSVEWATEWTLSRTTLLGLLGLSLLWYDKK